jgi:hypothetical protein
MSNLRRTWKMLMMLGAAGLGMLPSAARADWYKAVMEPGPDIVSVDVRWPYWPPGTYFALWNGNTAPAGGYFYGGVAIAGPGRDAAPEEQAKASLKLVWSFWGNEEVYKGNRVRIDSLGDETYGGVMSGEGTQAGLTRDLAFFKPGQWYRMLLRTWKDPKTPETKGYLGWWIGDLQKKEWHLMGVVSIPAKVTGVDCGGCFCEVIGPPGDRVIERRLGYHRVNGTWRKADTIRGIDGSLHHFKIVEDGSSFYYSSARTPEDAVKDGIVGKTELTLINQPALPVMNPPTTGSVKAVGFKGQVAVAWVVPGTSTPQLSYQIDLFPEPDAKGALLATSCGMGPSVRSHRLDAAAPVKSARLTITDVYDQKSAVVIPVTGETAMAATAPGANCRPGVRYSYYEAAAGETWARLPELAARKPLFRGVLNEFDALMNMGRPATYALKYSGFLKVPADGLYVLDLQSCDGSKLIIDGKTMIDNDGCHSVTSKYATVVLQRGLHPFDLLYFKSAGGEGNWLENKLKLAWEGPGMALRSLTASDFVCGPETGLPEITVQQRETNAKRPAIAPVAVANGHTLTRIELFCGKTRLAVLPPAGSESVYAAMLPSGPKTLWARLWYDDTMSLDSKPFECVTTNTVSAPWSYVVMGENTLPLGINAEADRVSMIGDCESFVYQPVTGDFDIRAKIGAISRSTKENGIAGDSLIGLMCRSQAKQQGGDDFSLWDTAGIGLRGTACDRDLETSRQSRYEVGDGKTHPWVRLVRRGTHMRAFSSQDGVRWEPVIDRLFRNLPNQLYVGVCLRTKNPGKNKSLFEGTVENISLSVPGPDAPAPASYTLSERDCFKGRIVSLVPTENRLLARTMGGGLLASTDAGAAWHPRNKGLDTPSGNAIRSVAVQPTHPAVLLRGGGTKLPGTAALWRSADSGESWTPVCRDIDFDGTGPSALGGEVIAFNPKDPQIVAAGGESSGLFVSRDAGVTWKYVGLKGERITVVGFSPYLKDLLIVGTSADTVAGAASMSPQDPRRFGRIYVATTGEMNLNKVVERQGLGITNVAFENIAEGGNYLYFATTHGVYYCNNLEVFYQYRTIVADAPYAALVSRPPGRERCDVYAAPYAPTSAAALYAGRIDYFWSVYWNARKSAAPLQEITGLAADPAAKTLWLCCRNGIFKSEDAGGTWHAVMAAKAP